MGGFECADHQNTFGERVDLYQTSGHEIYLEEDYDHLRQLDIKTVREGIRWSVVETKPYQYDWSEVERLIEISQNKNIQIIWDICHFGYPDDLTPLHPMFARRFSSLCQAFILKYRSLVPEGNLIVTPINEVSFISWLGGDVKGTSPYCVGHGWEVKYALMKAYIEGIEMMKAVDTSVRIMVTEPLISIVSNNQADAFSILSAEEKHFEQFQVHDILSGRICPELGGKPEYLDIIGVNFYYNNQWINETHEFLPWAEVPPHPQYRPLHELLESVFLRYGRPFVISETSHPGEDRAKWIRSITAECLSVLKAGLPLLGCCFYPVVDRPDWDDLSDWHHSGIWDIFDTVTLKRVPDSESVAELKEFKRKLNSILVAN
ncbi:amine oxidase [Chryseobacterium sp. GCR10]|uniref:Amine oxidase n=2 Tax=Chryseobacterium caseinilyticum TaxID=2771428 RepID=A0ABR8ZA33_9FLAO|nr:amine oxidase [Chryseobacterium caseinilyticum]